MNHPLFCATVLYSNKERLTFDFDLYSKNLIPEYVALLGDNCVKFEVRKGWLNRALRFPILFVLQVFGLSLQKNLRQQWIVIK